MSDYRAFLASKRLRVEASGFEVDPATLPAALFPFQRDICRWALRLGKAAVFANTGLGKTLMQLTIARAVHNRTGGDVLILAPLAVARQTAREGAKFGIAVTLCRDQSDVRPGINITNYERLHLFNPAHFVCIVLDESSILKAYDSATRNQIIAAFAATPYRFAFTATPAPNDHMELGNHAEFLGVMSRVEMLAMFFAHDGGETQKWRLKGHAVADFWRWVCSWAVLLRAPSDLGYDDGAFRLPPLAMRRHLIEDWTPQEGRLFAVEALTLTERREARRRSMGERVGMVKAIVDASHGIAACGSQNTPSGDVPNTRPMSRSGSDGAASRARPKRTANTCAPITSPTKSSTPSNGRPGPRSATAGDASGTPPIPSSASAARPPLVTGIGTASATAGYAPTSASVPPNTTPCSPHRAGNAPSAAPARATSAAIGSTSITTTPPEPCAGSSAPPATSVSASSATTPNSSCAPPATSTSNTPLEPWVIWCDLNAEQDALEAAFGDRAISIYGSLSPEEKNDRLVRWLDGERPVLISKPSICGFGINMQHCARIAFVGLSDSWEQYYQAIRRCWRFGQEREVECHVFVSTAEGAVLSNIERKEADAQSMAKEMVRHMSVHSITLGQTERQTDEYERKVERGAKWEAHRADCVDLARELAADSLDFIVYSPPFSSLYTYSNSPRDMGNCKGDGEFFAHFQYLTGEMFRALKPGRLMAVHCMNLPTSKAAHGHIGIRDFRGDLIRMFEAAGFIYHSEVCIWKDPVTAMQRTKAIGLLYKQLKKDSTISRQGIPDYLVVMRKPGDNPEPVTKDPEAFPVDLWQRYASPVWMDINPSDTLQRESAREEADERHIAPLQLEVIRRAVKLWTNPGDLVFSPFTGIGSEGYVALQEGRRFVGSELKESYWRQAVANLRRAEQIAASPTLFDLAAVGE